MSSNQGRLWWSINSKCLEQPCSHCLSGCYPNGFLLGMTLITICNFSPKKFHFLASLTSWGLHCTFRYTLTASVIALSIIPGRNCDPKQILAWPPKAFQICVENVPNCPLWCLHSACLKKSTPCRWCQSVLPTHVVTLFPWKTALMTSECFSGQTQRNISSVSPEWLWCTGPLFSRQSLKGVYLFSALTLGWCGLAIS